MNTQLSTASCKCCSFAGATPKHFHHYIQSTLNKKKKNKRDIAVLHMGTDDILNAEGDKDLITESVIGIANECVIELLTGVMCFKHFPVFLAFYESIHSKG